MAAAPFQIGLNPSARMTVRTVGHEAQPSMIIDNALENAGQLIDVAAATPFTPPDIGYYPDLTAPLPDGYLKPLTQALRPALTKAFGIPADGRPGLYGFFALAMLHHLSPTPRGGTAFFATAPLVSSR